MKEPRKSKVGDRGRGAAFDPPGALDADRLLERLGALHRSAESATRGRWVELYHRETVALRVGRDGVPGIVEPRIGGESGLAVRIRERGSRETRFAAATGGGEESLRWILAQADRAPGIGRSQEPEWPEGGEAVLTDRDSDSGLPSPADLEAWIGQAEDAIARVLPRGASSTSAECWVEVAATVESWIASGGLKASRARTRAWALSRLKPGRREAISLRPTVIAARRWNALAPQGWADLLAARGRTGRVFASVPSGPVLVLFGAESSAGLVSALVRTFHHDRPIRELPAGPGWKLFDDPRDSEALFGGRFDDAGFPTARKILADGERVLGILEGPGHFRRPSFRNPPAPHPSRLVVASNRETLPSRLFRVTDLVIHPLGPEDWILEVRGRLWVDGAPGPGTLEGHIRTGPGELVQRCEASSGRPLASFRGVVTPDLLFSDLEIRSS